MAIGDYPKQFPKGKLKEDDEGILGVKIGTVDDTVVIDFGKPVAWLGLTEDEIGPFINSLIKHAKTIMRTKPLEIQM
jgi:hypothetical protein